MRRNFVTGAMLVALVGACTAQDTGGDLVSFHAYGSGLATVFGSLDFDTGAGFHVHLTQATLHIGAVYLRLGQANPGSASASCVGDTTYGLEVPGSVDVNVLSASPQEFSVLGSATSDLDQSGEIWLVDGDINQVASTKVIAAVVGTATKDGVSYPFQGSMTIGQNHLIPPANPAEPGENPICKQRIVSPIPVSIRPAVGGDLLLRIDPRPWFGDVDFSTLSPGDDGTTLEIPDSSNGSGTDAAAGRAFFTAVTGASADVYQFSWVVPLVTDNNKSRRYYLCVPLERSGIVLFTRLGVRWCSRPPAPTTPTTLPSRRPASPRAERRAPEAAEMAAHRLLRCLIQAPEVST